MEPKNTNSLLTGLVVFLFMVIIFLGYLLVNGKSNDLSVSLQQRLEKLEQDAASLEIENDLKSQNEEIPDQSGNNTNDSGPVNNDASSTVQEDENTNTSTDQPTVKKVQKYESVKESNTQVLYRVFTDGSREKTGLAVSYDWDPNYKVNVNIVVSPDQKKAVYNKWAGVAMYIYISEIDGRNVRELAVQEIPEGSGGLNAQSITWSPDSQYITYEETGVACPGNCESPEDFAPQIIIYRVNVVTGNKLIVSKSTLPQ